MTEKTCQFKSLAVIPAHAHYVIVCLFVTDECKSEEECARGHAFVDRCNCLFICFSTALPVFRSTPGSGVLTTELLSRPLMWFAAQMCTAPHTHTHTRTHARTHTQTKVKTNTANTYSLVPVFVLSQALTANEKTRTGSAAFCALMVP